MTFLRLRAHRLLIARFLSGNDDDDDDDKGSDDA